MILGSMLKFDEAPIQTKEKINEIPMKYFTINPVTRKQFPKPAGLHAVARFALRDEECWWGPLQPEGHVQVYPSLKRLGFGNQ